MAAPRRVSSINRLALGTYDMAFGDINLLIKFRNQTPNSRQDGIHDLQQASLCDRRA
jgi:hypothetical protein